MPIDMKLWGNFMLPVTCPFCQHVTNEYISKMMETEVCICSECGKSIIITEIELETLASMQQCVCGAIEE